MAEAVVHELEAVEVEEHHDRRRSVVAQAPGDGVAQAVDEEEAIGEAGERIVQGLVGQHLLRLFAFGDIADIDDVATDRGAVSHVGDHRLGVAPRSVVMLDPELQGLDVRLRDEKGRQLRLDLGPVVGVHEIGGLEADELVGFSPQQRACGRAGVEDDPTGAEEQSGVRRILHE